MEWLLLPCVLSLARAVTPTPAPWQATQSTTAAPVPFTSAPPPMKIYSGTTCHGTQHEYEICPGLHPCAPCVPTNCQFSAWGLWAQGPGCTGVCKRQRTIQVPSNECGNPCQGELISTKECIKPECKHAYGTDCTWSAWSEWIPATGSTTAALCSDPLQQKKRTRTFTQPQDGGKPCTGPYIQTLPCTQPYQPVDCSFGPWSAFTDCSTTCGPGRMSRVRRILHSANHGGKACDGNTREMVRCEMAACAGGDQNCTLTQWSQWTGCDVNDHYQKSRRREVLVPVLNGGSSCVLEPLQEVVGCQNIFTDTECVLTPWSGWTVCDRSCDGGQQTRHRILQNPDASGSCAIGPVREIQPCGTGVCRQPSTLDCQLGAWLPWNQCSSECGIGVRYRNRHVTPATGNGLGCGTSLLPANLEEVGQCTGTSNCNDVDCRWGQWEAWGGCTLSCGGGTKRRHRHVIQQPRRHGRKCSAESKYEIAPCNTEDCPNKCIDAVWAGWSHWSKCSTTCGPGYYSRVRHLAQEANDCGQAASGLRSEFAQCMAPIHCVPPKDCAVGAWSSWAACTATCFGIQERTRVITQFPQGIGKLCDPNIKLREIQACNPTIGAAAPDMCDSLTPDQDCILSQWDAWDSCSKTCGRGQRNRYRHVLQHNHHNGRKCDNTTVTGQIAAKLAAQGPNQGYTVLAETEGCSMEACPGHEATDCQMSQWGHWGACSKASQQIRTRAIIQFQDANGKPCSETHTKEIRHCGNGVAQNLYCTYGEWSSWGNCPQDSCGTATTRRHRSLGIATHTPADSSNILFEMPQNTGTFVCSGSQEEQKRCVGTNCKAACVPVDCVFQPWADWSAPHPEGLCRAHRQVQTMNNECGKVCNGVLIKTKVCTPRDKIVLPCHLSHWSMWSQCSSPVGQRYRIRTIRQRPQNGGTPCPNANLRETQPCAVVQMKGGNSEDCGMTQWSAWGLCTRTCDAGWQRRERRIDIVAMHGGALCNFSMEEVQACSTNPCNASVAVPCELGEWSAWGACGVHGQRYRSKEIIRPAQYGGEGCNSSVLETESCTMTAVNCELSAWTAWDPCSQTCDGGTRLRHRQVQRWPLNGGLECPRDLVLTEIGICSNVTCETSEDDCLLSPWSLWSAAPCSAQCGPGQITRGRLVLRDRKPNGIGCSANLQEVGPCLNNPPCTKTDCLWTDWTLWSTCSKSCGGGQARRTRQLAQEPKHGGAACQPGPKEELRGCSTQQCAGEACIDGKWGQWSAFEACSLTCRGGTTWRSRQVETVATSCGKPPVGDSHQVASCNGDIACLPDVDCKLSDWAAWSACSATCNGVQRRSRRVMVEGSGNGKGCDGGLKEAAPCSPEANGTLPAACPHPGDKRDCILAQWGPWGACSKPCGGGQQDRERTITTPAYGGGTCTDNIKETRGCNLDRCTSPCGTTMCVWTAWSAWGACNKCGGEQYRTRHVTPPTGGGHICEMRASKEVRGCPGDCHQNFYCTWGSWSTWSSCSHTCGDGVRYHHRDLTLVNMPSHRLLSSTEQRQRLYEADSDGGKSDLEERFHQLYRQSMKDEANRQQQLLGAFAAGGFGLLACLVLGMAVSRIGGVFRTTGVWVAAEEQDGMSSTAELE